MMRSMCKKVPLYLCTFFMMIFVLCLNVKADSTDVDFTLSTSSLTFYNDRIGDKYKDSNDSWKRKTVTISGLTSEELDDLQITTTQSKDYEDLLFDYELDGSKLTVISYYGSGTGEIRLQLDDVVKTIKIKFYNVYLSGGSQFYLVKGKTKQLSVKGYSGKVSWKTSKKSAVSVSSSGKIKSRKEGNVIIYAVMPDGTKIGCLVMSVSKTRLKIVKRAKYIASHWKYSQAKRMNNGYFDCSSLVWKAYKYGGKKLISKSYAPTAASLGKWMVQHKKRVKGDFYTNLKKLKYKPGALSFETGAKNGRYKGIYHVEMFTGYEFYGFQNNSISKPMVYPTFARNYSVGSIIAQPF